ncbi:MAG: DUF177 domain-containing protein [Alphaproteobacteria bacterium]|nr:DUF177 domain-containing protein [Alphaproteobacteria bacterium]
MTGEFDIRILRRLWHRLGLRNQAAVPISVIHEVGEFALTDMPAMPEFSRPVQVDAIGADGAVLEMQADAAERAALAERLGLQSVADLQVVVSLRRTAAGLVRLNVDFSANVVQSCVVTLEPVAAKVADRFSLLCEGEQKREKRSDTEGEVFVDPFGEDPIEPLEDGRIDVGELVAQHLSLSLDPSPRLPGIKTGVVMAGAGIEEAGTHAGADHAGAGMVAGDDGAPEDNAGASPDKASPFAVLERWRSGGRPGGQGDGGSGNGAA